MDYKKQIVGSPSYVKDFYTKSEGDFFDYLMLNLPGGCNYSCSKCFNKNDLAKLNESNFDNDKLLMFIEKIIIESKKIGLKAVAFGGQGEPTLAKLYPKLMQLIGIHGLIPIVFTNGSTLIPKAIEKYLDYKPVYLINFDFVDEYQYNKHVGVSGAFTKIMNNLEYLRSSYDKLKIYENGKLYLRLALLSALNASNYQCIDEIKKFAGKDFVSVINNTADVGGAEEKNNALSFKSFTREQAYKLSDTGGHTMFDGKYCGFLLNGLSIDVDGTILPCAHSTEFRGKRFTIYEFANNNVDNITSEKLIELYSTEKQKVKNIFSKFGQDSCILRHKDYKEILKSSEFIN